MNSMTTNSIGTILTVLLLFNLAFNANGAGGGGGVSPLPSASAPSFDPVEKYNQGIEYLKQKKYKKARRYVNLLK